MSVTDSLRLVQLAHPARGRYVAIVAEPELHVLETFTTVYELALAALQAGTTLRALLRNVPVRARIQYDEVYEGQSEFRLLVPFDHPTEPARCLVSGTGLTHRVSAERRNAMHGTPQQETDSMRMFRSGLEGGKPTPGQIGVEPEWFYKGDGRIVRAHNEPITAPPFDEEAGEEAELVGCYVIDPQGQPCRVGICLGNELSDHRLERRNYLYLASSKLRECSAGPELVVEPDLHDVHGTVAVERHWQPLWQQPIASGEHNMSHAISNLEHHHFKHPGHRQPGDVHLHYFGADAFSFGDNIQLQDGDVMAVAYAGFGRALRNPLRRVAPMMEPVTLLTL